MNIIDYKILECSSFTLSEIIREFIKIKNYGSSRYIFVWAFAFRVLDSGEGKINDREMKKKQSKS